MGDYGYDYNLMTRQLNQLTSPTGGKLDLSYSGALLTGMAFSGEVTGSVAYSYDSAGRLSKFTKGPAETGQWTAKDQIDFRGGSTNLYEYVDNDAIHIVDPDGLERYSENCPDNEKIF